MTAAHVSSLEVPDSYRALQFSSTTSPPAITILPTPSLTAGTVLVKPLRVSVVSYIADIFTRGNPRGYRFPLPIVPGSSSVGRVIAAASDVPTLQQGDLVWVDPVLRAKDGSTRILHGLNGPSTPAAAALMEGEWRDGSWGEVVRVPADNVHRLNEKTLLGPTEEGALGYGIDDLGYIATLVVAYGGLRDANVRPGDTVLVAPSTGSFGGAAVHVALALGANVIAVGRNAAILGDLEVVAKNSYPLSKLIAIPMSSDIDVDGMKTQIKAAAAELGNRNGTVDVFFDMSPPSASNSPHIKAGLLSLRPGGTMCLMGGAAGDVSIPYFDIMFRGLKLQGTFMYNPGDADELIRMVETGRLKMGEKHAGVKCVGVYELDEWEQAFAAAEAKGRAGRYVLLAPNGT